MAGQDDDHILQLINQNEERNRQAFGSGNTNSSTTTNHNTNNNNNIQFSNHHASPFNVAGRISSLVDFDFRPSPINIQSSQNNSSQTSGMFNPITFNNANHNHTHHHQHLKAASQAQPPIMQNNNNNPPNPNTGYHNYHLAAMGHSNQASSGGPDIMNPNAHHLFGGHIPIPNSMTPQTSRLVSGAISSNQLSVSNSLSVPSVTAPFVVHSQSNNYRPASSEAAAAATKRSSSKNGDSPRRTFACPTCGKGFTEKFNMKRHMQIHSQSRPKYVCNECSKSFAWKDNFIRHKKAAHGNNSIQYQV